MGLIKQSRIQKVKQRRLQTLKRFNIFSLNVDDNLRIEKKVTKRHTSSGELSSPHSIIKKRKENEENARIFEDKKKNEVRDEDEEIKYLEKKLGLHGASKKKNLNRLKKEWKEIDGLEDWLDLTENILNFNENSTNNNNVDENHESNLNGTLSDSDSSQNSAFSSSVTSLSVSSPYTFNENDTETKTSLHNYKLRQNNAVSHTKNPVQNKTNVKEGTTDSKDNIVEERACNKRTSVDSQETTHASLKSAPDIFASSNDRTSHVMYETDDDTIFKNHSKKEDISVCRDSSFACENESVMTLSKRSDEIGLTKEAKIKKLNSIKKEEKELNKDIQTKITRYVNRIAEGNLSLITEQIIDEIFVTSTHSVAENKLLLNHKLSLISKSFANQVVLNAIENTFSTPSLVASQTAVLIVLTVRLGYTIGEQFIVSLILTFHNLWTRFQKQAEHFLEEENCKDLRDVKICLRLASIAFSLLFDFGLINKESVFVFITFLMKDQNIKEPNLANFVTEMRLELVLVCFRHIGIKLKATSPHDINDIIKFCLKFQDNVNKNISKRHFYFIEELQDMLHHNKFNHSASERYQFIREWLQTTIKNFTNKISKNLVPEGFVFTIPPCDDIIHHNCVPKCALSEDSKMVSVSSLELATRLHHRDHQNTTSLLSLAKKLRLHTDIQISTFLALLNAQDVSNGVQRLLLVANKKNLIPHAVSVIFHLCQKEKVFNSFYPEILIHLSSLPSSIGKHYQKTIQHGISSTLTQLHLWSFRRVMIYAKLVSFLTCSPLANINLKVIRFVPFKSCNNLQETKKVQLFLIQVCTELCVWDTKDTTNNDAYTDHFIKQIQSILQYGDIAKIFVSAAKRFLKDNYDPFSQEKAKLILNYLREQY